MTETIITELKANFQKVRDHLKGELATIRTGRASSSLVEGIEVEAYETKMRISELATITIPEAALIIIQPWDASAIPAIEKALRESSLDINPLVDLRTIRLPLPPLTQERREEFVKLAGERVEEAKVTVRNIRHELLDRMKEARDSGEIGEDEEFRLKKIVQEEVDKATEEIVQLGKRKEEELLKV